MTKDKQIINITLNNEIEYQKRVDKEDICKRIKYEDITVEYSHKIVGNRRRNNTNLVYSKIEMNEYENNPIEDKIEEFSYEIEMQSEIGRQQQQQIHQYVRIQCLHIE